MKKALIFLIFITTLSLASCRVFESYRRVDKYIKDISLGMTKEEVVNVLGDSYKIVGLANEQAGALEIVSYSGMSSEWIYMLYFLDGKLDQMQKEYAVPAEVASRPNNNDKHKHR